VIPNAYKTLTLRNAAGLTEKVTKSTYPVWLPRCIMVNQHRVDQILKMIFGLSVRLVGDRAPEKPVYKSYS